MPKKLTIIDPNTGLEIVEHFVSKMPANHTELEGETFGLGSDNFLNIPDRVTTRKTPRLTRGQDKTVCLFPGVAGESEVFLDHIQFNKLKKKEEDGTAVEETFIHEDNKGVTYRNGQKGVRHSLSIFPCISHSDVSKSRQTWKDKPDVIYDKKGIRNRELTVYFKVGDPIFTTGLRRVAIRLGGAYNVKPVDRSFIEIGYPTQDYPDIYLSVAYAAGRNVLVSTVNQYFAGDRVVPHKWIGLKIVSLVDKSKSHIWYGIYTDLNPFDDSDIHNNSIPLNNWKLKADIIFTGVKEYANIIPTWKCEYDSIVIDGYESVEFKGVSDREVDFMGLKPLHQNLSVMITETDDDDTPLFRKAMVPTHLNLNDYELQEDVVITNNNTTSSTSKKVSHTTLSIPRADRDNNSNPKDPGFYGVYTH